MSGNFNHVRKGYDPAEVDTYIDSLESVVKSYKEKDASIKNAIVSAQIAGDAIVAGAKDKADKLVSDSIELVSEISRRVAEQRSLISSFKNEYDEMMKKYTKLAEESDFNGIYSKIEELERYLESARNAGEQKKGRD